MSWQTQKSNNSCTSSIYGKEPFSGVSGVLYWQSHRLRHLIRTVSITLVGTFFLQQIAWAQGEKPLWNAENTSDYHLKIKQLQSFQLPSEVAKVSDVRDDLSEEIIINIQDAHDRVGAQESISEVLDNLVSNYDLKIIGLEGADGYIDVDLLSSFPDKEARGKIAKDYMEKSVLNAGEFFAITSDKPVALYGVESEELYQDNLADYRKNHDNKKEALRAIKRIQASIKKLDKKVLSTELVQLKKASLKHKRGNVSFSKHWKALLPHIKAYKVDYTSYPSLSRLVKTIELEGDINFKGATAERKSLARLISKELPKDDLENFILKSLAFKVGKISSGAYHSYMQTIAKKLDIPSDDYPNLIKYTTYITKYESVNIISLYQEIESFENDLKEKMFKNDDQRHLTTLWKQTEILEGFFKLMLMQSDLDYYRQNKDLITLDRISNTLKDISDKNNTVFTNQDDIEKTFELLPTAINFYHGAEERNMSMFNKTIERMRASGQNVAALITGGFHTHGLKDIFKSNNVSYVVILPKFGKDSPRRPYVAILTNKQSSYQDLIDSGEYHISVHSFIKSEQGAQLQADMTKDLLRPVLEQIFSDSETLSEFNQAVRDLADRWNEQYVARREALERENLIDSTVSIELLRQIEDATRSRAVGDNPFHTLITRLIDDASTGYRDRLAQQERRVASGSEINPIRPVIQVQAITLNAARNKIPEKISVDTPEAVRGTPVDDDILDISAEGQATLDAANIMASVIVLARPYLLNSINPSKLDDWRQLITTSIQKLEEFRSEYTELAIAVFSDARQGGLVESAAREFILTLGDTRLQESVVGVMQLSQLLSEEEFRQFAREFNIGVELQAMFLEQITTVTPVDSSAPERQVRDDDGAVSSGIEVDGAVARKWVANFIKEHALLSNIDPTDSDQSLVEKLIEHLSFGDPLTRAREVPDGMLSTNDYVAGPFTRNEISDTPLEAEYLELDMIGTVDEVLRGVSRQLSQEASIEDLGFEPIRDFLIHLYWARNENGNLFIGNVDESMNYRWVYREIPRLLAPIFADDNVDRAELETALLNPFKISNEAGNEAMRAAISDLKANLPDRFKDGVDNLQGDDRKRYIKNWALFAIAGNLIDYSRPAILTEIDKAGGNLYQYIIERIDVPFLKELGGEKYFDRLIDMALTDGAEIIHVPDNNAEIVASIKLAEVLLIANPTLKITMIAKTDNGAMNDASVNDVRYQIDNTDTFQTLRDIEKNGRFRLISGAASHGTPLNRLSPEAEKVLSEATTNPKSIILAEGEANTWDSFSGYNHPRMFFMLRQKWTVGVKHFIGVEPQEDRPPALFMIDGTKGPYFGNAFGVTGGESFTIRDTLAKQKTVSSGNEIILAGIDGEEWQRNFDESKLPLRAYVEKIKDKIYERFKETGDFLSIQKRLKGLYDFAFRTVLSQVLENRDLEISEFNRRFVVSYAGSMSRAELSFDSDIDYLVLSVNDEDGELASDLAREMGERLIAVGIDAEQALKFDFKIFTVSRAKEILENESALSSDSRLAQERGITAEWEESTEIPRSELYDMHFVVGNQSSFNSLSAIAHRHLENTDSFRLQLKEHIPANIPPIQNLSDIRGLKSLAIRPFQIFFMIMRTMNPIEGWEDLTDSSYKQLLSHLKERGVIADSERERIDEAMGLLLTYKTHFSPQARVRFSPTTVANVMKRDEQTAGEFFVELNEKIDAAHQDILSIFRRNAIIASSGSEADSDDITFSRRTLLWGASVVAVLPVLKPLEVVAEQTASVLEDDKLSSADPLREADTRFIHSKQRDIVNAHANRIVAWAKNSNEEADIAEYMRRKEKRSGFDAFYVEALRRQAAEGKGLDVAVSQQAILKTYARSIGATEEELDDIWRSYVADIDTYFEKAIAFSKDIQELGRTTYQMVTTDNSPEMSALSEEAYIEMQLGPTTRISELQTLRELYKDLALIGYELPISLIIPTQESAHGFWEGLPPIINRSPNVSQEERLKALARVKGHIIKLLDLEIAHLDRENEVRSVANLNVPQRANDLLKEAVKNQAGHNLVRTERIKVLEAQKAKIEGASSDEETVEAIIGEVKSLARRWSGDYWHFDKLNEKAWNLKREERSFIKKSTGLKSAYAWTQGEMTKRLQKLNALYLKMGWPVPLAEIPALGIDMVNLHQFAPPLGLPIDRALSPIEVRATVDEIMQLHEELIDLQIKLANLEAQRKVADLQLKAEEQELVERYGLRQSQGGRTMSALHAQRNLIFHTILTDGPDIRRQVENQENLIDALEAERKLLSAPSQAAVATHVKNYETAIMTYLKAELARVRASLRTERNEHKRADFEEHAKQLEAQIAIYELQQKRGRRIGFIRPKTPSLPTWASIEKEGTRTAVKAKFQGHLKVKGEDGTYSLKGTMTPGFAPTGESVAVGGDLSGKSTRYIRHPEGGVTPAARIISLETTLDLFQGDHPLKQTTVYSPVVTPVIRRVQGAGTRYIEGSSDLFTIDGDTQTVGRDHDRKEHILVGNAVHTFDAEGNRVVLGYGVRSVRLTDDQSWREIQKDARDGETKEGEPIIGELFSPGHKWDYGTYTVEIVEHKKRDASGQVVSTLELVTKAKPVTITPPSSEKEKKVDDSTRPKEDKSRDKTDDAKKADEKPAEDKTDNTGLIIGGLATAAAIFTAFAYRFMRNRGDDGGSQGDTASSGAETLEAPAESRLMSINNLRQMPDWQLENAGISFARDLDTADRRILIHNGPMDDRGVPLRALGLQSIVETNMKPTDEYYFIAQDAAINPDPQFLAYDLREDVLLTFENFDTRSFIDVYINGRHLISISFNPSRIQIDRNNATVEEMEQVIQLLTLADQAYGYLPYNLLQFVKMKRDEKLIERRRTENFATATEGTVTALSMVVNPSGILLSFLTALVNWTARSFLRFVFSEDVDELDKYISSGSEWDDALTRRNFMRVTGAAAFLGPLALSNSASAWQNQRLLDQDKRPELVERFKKFSGVKRIPRLRLDQTARKMFEEGERYLRLSTNEELFQTGRLSSSPIQADFSAMSENVWVPNREEAHEVDYEIALELKPNASNMRREVSIVMPTHMGAIEVMESRDVTFDSTGKVVFKGKVRIPVDEYRRSRQVVTSGLAATRQFLVNYPLESGSLEVNEIFVAEVAGEFHKLVKEVYPALIRLEADLPDISPAKIDGQLKKLITDVDELHKEALSTFNAKMGFADLHRLSEKLMLLLMRIQNVIPDDKLTLKVLVHSENERDAISLHGPDGEVSTKTKIPDARITVSRGSDGGIYGAIVYKRPQVAINEEGRVHVASPEAIITRVDKNSRREVIYQGKRAIAYDAVAIPGELEGERVARIYLSEDRQTLLGITDLTERAQLFTAVEEVSLNVATPIDQAFALNDSYAEGRRMSKVKERRDWVLEKGAFGDYYRWRHQPTAPTTMTRVHAALNYMERLQLLLDMEEGLSALDDDRVGGLDFQIKLGNMRAFNELALKGAGTLPYLPSRPTDRRSTHGGILLFYKIMTMSATSDGAIAIGNEPDYWQPILFGVATDHYVWKEASRRLYWRDHAHKLGPDLNQYFYDVQAAWSIIESSPWGMRPPLLRNVPTKAWDDWDREMQRRSSPITGKGDLWENIYYRRNPTDLTSAYPSNILPSGVRAMYTSVKEYLTGPERHYCEMQIARLESWKSGEGVGMSAISENERKSKKYRDDVQSLEDTRKLLASKIGESLAIDHNLLQQSLLYYQNGWEASIELRHFRRGAKRGDLAKTLQSLDKAIEFAKEKESQFQQAREFTPLPIGDDVLEADGARLDARRSDGQSRRDTPQPSADSARLDARRSDGQSRRDTPQPSFELTEKTSQEAALESVTTITTDLSARYPFIDFSTFTTNPLRESNPQGLLDVLNRLRSALIQIELDAPEIIQFLREVLGYWNEQARVVITSDRPSELRISVVAPGDTLIKPRAFRISAGEAIEQYIRYSLFDISVPSLQIAYMDDKYPNFYYRGGIDNPEVLYVILRSINEGFDVISSLDPTFVHEKREARISTDGRVVNVQFSNMQTPISMSLEQDPGEIGSIVTREIIGFHLGYLDLPKADRVLWQEMVDSENGRIDVQFKKALMAHLFPDHHPLPDYLTTHHTEFVASLITSPTDGYKSRQGILRAYKDDRGFGVARALAYTAITLGTLGAGAAAARIAYKRSTASREGDSSTEDTVSSGKEGDQKKIQTVSTGVLQRSAMGTVSSEAEKPTDLTESQEIVWNLLTSDTDTDITIPWYDAQNDEETTRTVKALGLSPDKVRTNIALLGRNPQSLIEYWQFLTGEEDQDVTVNERDSQGNVTRVYTVKALGFSSNKVRANIALLGRNPQSLIEYWQFLTGEEGQDITINKRDTQGNVTGSYTVKALGLDPNKVKASPTLLGRNPKTLRQQRDYLVAENVGFSTILPNSPSYLTQSLWNRQVNFSSYLRVVRNRMIKSGVDDLPVNILVEERPFLLIASYGEFNKVLDTISDYTEDRNDFKNIWPLLAEVQRRHQYNDEPLNQDWLTNLRSDTDLPKPLKNLLGQQSLLNTFFTSDGRLKEDYNFAYPLPEPISSGAEADDIWGERKRVLNELINNVDPDPSIMSNFEFVFEVESYLTDLDIPKRISTEDSLKRTATRLVAEISRLEELPHGKTASEIAQEGLSKEGSVKDKIAHSQLVLEQAIRKRYDQSIDQVETFSRFAQLIGRYGQFQPAHNLLIAMLRTFNYAGSVSANYDRVRRASIKAQAAIFDNPTNRQKDVTDSLKADYVAIVKSKNVSQATKIEAIKALANIGAEAELQQLLDDTDIGLSPTVRVEIIEQLIESIHDTDSNLQMNRRRQVARTYKSTIEDLLSTENISKLNTSSLIKIINLIGMYLSLTRDDQITGLLMARAEFEDIEALHGDKHIVNLIQNRNRRDSLVAIAAKRALVNLDIPLPTYDATLVSEAEDRHYLKAIATLDPSRDDYQDESNLIMGELVERLKLPSRRSLNYTKSREEAIYLIVALYSNDEGKVYGEDISELELDARIDFMISAIRNNPDPLVNFLGAVSRRAESSGFPASLYAIGEIIAELSIQLPQDVYREAILVLERALSNANNRRGTFANDEGVTRNERVTNLLIEAITEVVLPQYTYALAMEGIGHLGSERTLVDFIKDDALEDRLRLMAVKQLAALRGAINRETRSAEYLKGLMAPETFSDLTDEEKIEALNLIAHYKVPLNRDETSALRSQMDFGEAAVSDAIRHLLSGIRVVASGAEHASKIIEKVVSQLSKEFTDENYGWGAALRDDRASIDFSIEYTSGDWTKGHARILSPELYASQRCNDCADRALALYRALKAEDSGLEVRVVKAKTPIWDTDFLVQVKVDGEWKGVTLTPGVAIETLSEISPVTIGAAQETVDKRRRDGLPIIDAFYPWSYHVEGEYAVIVSGGLGITELNQSGLKEYNRGALTLGKVIQPQDELTIAFQLDLAKDGDGIYEIEFEGKIAMGKLLQLKKESKIVSTEEALRLIDFKVKNEKGSVDKEAEEFYERILREEQGLIYQILTKINMASLEKAWQVSSGSEIDEQITKIGEKLKDNSLSARRKAAKALADFINEVSSFENISQHVNILGLIERSLSSDNEKDIQVRKDVVSAFGRFINIFRPHVAFVDGDQSQKKHSSTYSQIIDIIKQSLNTDNEQDELVRHRMSAIFARTLDTAAIEGVASENADNPYQDSIFDIIEYYLDRNNEDNLDVRRNMARAFKIFVQREDLVAKSKSRAHRVIVAHDEKSDEPSQIVRGHIEEAAEYVISSGTEATVEEAPLSLETVSTTDVTYVVGLKGDVSGVEELITATFGAVASDIAVVSADSSSQLASSVASNQKAIFLDFTGRVDAALQAQLEVLIYGDLIRDGTYDREQLANIASTLELSPIQAFNLVLFVNGYPQYRQAFSNRLNPDTLNALDNLVSNFTDNDVRDTFATNTLPAIVRELAVADSRNQDIQGAIEHLPELQLALARTTNISNRAAELASLIDPASSIDLSKGDVADLDNKTYVFLAGTPASYQVKPQNFDDASQFQLFIPFDNITRENLEDYLIQMGYADTFSPENVLLISENESFNVLGGFDADTVDIIGATDIGEAIELQALDKRPDTNVEFVVSTDNREQAKEVFGELVSLIVLTLKGGITDDRQFDLYMQQLGAYLETMNVISDNLQNVLTDDIQAFKTALKTAENYKGHVKARIAEYINHQNNVVTSV